MEKNFKMKAKLIFLSVIFSLGSYCFVTGKKQVISDIALYNIEALAAGESTFIQCYGEGTVDCPIDHSKVNYIIHNR